MPPRIIDCEQGSPLWHDSRAGCATASRFVDIMEGKGARDRYLWELVAERLAGPMRDAGGMAKDWGHDSEPLARKEYQIRKGVLVRQVGFALHARIKWVGASADGLVGDDGMCEIKSPFNSSVHARTLALGMPDAHYWQVLGNLWVYERQWLDFCSFDPAFPAPHDLYVKNFQRVETSIKHLEKEVKLFLAEVATATADIKNSIH
jgi:hypothetical protein